VNPQVTEQVHIIPVGFDYERLFQPITQGNLEADRVILLHSARESADKEVRRLANTMVNKLEETFDTVLGKTVERRPIEDIFEFENLYTEAHRMIQTEINQGNDVWVNISSMPRTVAFAFATAANSLVVEEPDLRSRVHTYYVSPEEYLVTSLISELREQRELLQDLAEDRGTERIEERFEEVDKLVKKVDSSGITKGASKMNGGLHVEFPVIPPSELHKFERIVLKFLEREGKTKSTSELARKLADEIGEDSTDSFNSTVQYNVKQLEKKGFIQRDEVKNRYETQISTMGKLWVQTHSDGNPSPLVA
jgi:vacuolar-type H+-ATPase subunit H